MNAKLSVVIPCYNAANNIENVIDKDINIFEQKNITDYEFILVNDCSKDDTWTVIKGLAEKNNRIRCVNLAKNSGQHGAIMAGFHFVSGDYVVVSDDDGQTQMEVIDQLFEKMAEGYDVVSTDWVERGKRSLFRRMGTKLGVIINDILMDNPKDVVVSIFFMAKRFVIDEMVKYNNPYPYIAGLVLRTTHNIGTIEVEQLSRQSGSSGYSLKKLLSLWMNGFTAFSVKPLRVASYLGVSSALIGFIYGIVIVIRRLVTSNVMPGWSSITAIMLFMFGIILLVLGLIGEYLGRIYICLNNAPQYVVKECVNVNSEEKVGDLNE